jgi:hypothetical protein
MRGGASRIAVRDREKKSLNRLSLELV